MRSSQNFTLKSCFFGPVWILSFLLFFLIGCNSSELAELTSIRSTPVSITALNLDPFTNVIFYGKRSDGMDGFAKIFTSAPAIERELRNGRWSFYGIAYSGFSVSQCAQAFSEVEKNKKFITLNFSNANCADPVFLGADSALNPSGPGTVSFSTTQLELCESVQGITSSTDMCTDDLNQGNRKQARGHTRSFRYSLRSFERTRGNYEFSGDAITSACVFGAPFPGSLGGLSTSRLGFNIPAGDGSTTPFYVSIEFFPLSHNCTVGTPIKLDLPFGLTSVSPKTKHVIIPGTPAEHKLYVKLAGDEICTGDYLTAEFAGGNGDPDSPRLICNATQLYNMFPANTANYLAYASSRYKLLSDIDLSNIEVGAATGNYHPVWEPCVTAGSNFMPLGTRADCTIPGGPLNLAQFDGGGKTITGLKIHPFVGKVGLYFQITGSAIRRLTLKDAIFVGPGNVGLLVGESYNSTIQNIRIISSNVKGTLGSTGGLVGSAQGGTFKDIIMTDARVVGTTAVGGIIGRGIYSGSTTVNISDTFVHGEVRATATASVVGGLVGQYGSAGQRSTISNSRFMGTVEGFKVVGGLTGSSASARFENTYVQATIKTLENVNNNQAGGLSGTFMSPLGDGTSGIHASYFDGSFIESCPIDNFTCNIGTLIGVHGGFTNVEIPSAVYSDSSYIFMNSGHLGFGQDDDSFLTMTPGWTGAAGADIMPLFDPNIWEFRNGQMPRLKSEPQ